MAAGFPITKAVIDSRAGFLVKTLRDTLRDIRIVKTWLDATPDADLVALGYSTEDVALLKSAFGDAEDVQANASDFFFWAKRLVGLD